MGWIQGGWISLLSLYLMGGLAGWRRVGCALLVLSLAACDEFPAQRTLGIEGVNARFRIVTVLCPGERVRSVSLVRVRGPIHLDEDDELLWRITSSGGSPVKVYVPGFTPAGFSETKDLGMGLPDDGRLAVRVQTDQVISSAVFSMRDLRPGYVYSTEEYLTPEQFQRRGESTCK